MARNKYPEETEKLIVNTAMKLFLEQGYDHTTLQDIIDRLGGLTKGAVYHHFASKEEILSAVSEKIFSSNSLGKTWTAIREEKELTGSEKLNRMFMAVFQDEEENSFRGIGVDLKNTPRLLSELLVRSLKEVAPRYFAPVIRQGIQDGSIDTQYPDELAEVVVLLMNFWISPLVFSARSETVRRRFDFLCDAAQRLGLGELPQELYAEIDKKNHA